MELRQEKVHRSTALECMAGEYLASSFVLGDFQPRQLPRRPWVFWYRPYPNQAEMIDLAFKRIRHETGCKRRGARLIYLCRHRLFMASRTGVDNTGRVK
jgi:hypothetical protein